MPVIYIINWINNNYFYVGQTKNIKQRENKHLYRMKKNKHENSRIQNVYNKYGEPQFHIIEECSIEELNEREQFYLDLLFDEPDCLNLAKDAIAPTRGLKHSAEAKKKMSVAWKNIKKSPKKSAMSEEHKQKISEALKGRKLSDETKIKLSIAKLGKGTSETTRQKIAKAKFRPVLQFSLEGEFIKEWTSIKEASEIMSVYASNISFCCSGKLKKTGGFVWKYK